MKYNFGNYAVVDSHTHYFEKQPEWWWKIRPSASKDELAMAQFYAQNSRPVKGEDGKNYEQLPFWIETMWHEIAVLFDGTNLPASEIAVEEGGEPVLKVGDSLSKVKSVLQAMPQAMVVELWKALGECTPFWGPAVSLPKNAPAPEEPTGVSG